MKKLNSFVGHNYSGDVSTEAFEVISASARFDHFVVRLLAIQDSELLMAERS